MRNHSEADVENQNYGVVSGGKRSDQEDGGGECNVLKVIRDAYASDDDDHVWEDDFHERTKVKNINEEQDRCEHCNVYFYNIVPYGSLCMECNANKENCDLDHTEIPLLSVDRQYKYSIDNQPIKVDIARSPRSRFSTDDETSSLVKTNVHASEATHHATAGAWQVAASATAGAGDVFKDAELEGVEDPTSPHMMSTTAGEGLVMGWQEQGTVPSSKVTTALHGRRVKRLKGVAAPPPFVKKVSFKETGDDILSIISSVHQK